MRTTLVGVLAAFAIGCGAPAIDSTGAAIVEPPPPTPVPPWCANCPQTGWRMLLQRSVLDPVRLATDYGRPDLAPEIARRAAALVATLDRSSPDQADGLYAAFIADLDRLAQ
jgi:hypothetical protein